MLKYSKWPPNNNNSEVKGLMMVKRVMCINLQHTIHFYIIRIRSSLRTMMMTLLMMIPFPVFIFTSQKITKQLEKKMYRKNWQLHHSSSLVNGYVGGGNLAYSESNKYRWWKQRNFFSVNTKMLKLKRRKQETAKDIANQVCTSCRQKDNKRTL